MSVLSISGNFKKKMNTHTKMGIYYETQNNYII